MEKQPSRTHLQQRRKTSVGGMLDNSVSTRSSRQSHARLTIQSSTSSLLSTTYQSSDDKSTRESSADDSVSHFFAIETRLALQERLVALQQRLRELLVRTKLAWMKCFAAPAQVHESNDSKRVDGATSTPLDALDAAQSLVHQGEALMLKLERAFTTATATASCPILSYSELVESAERDFAAFEALVERIAQHPIVSASGASASPTTGSVPSASASAATGLTRHGPHASAANAVQFDLPSMQSYCAKVAPPYSSYLPARKTPKSYKA